MDVPHARVTTCRSTCRVQHVVYNMSFILIEFTYYFKHIFIQYISVHLYKGPDFIPDRGPKIASPPLTRKISLYLVCSLLFSHEASLKCRENYGDSFSVIYGIYDVT